MGVEECETPAMKQREQAWSGKLAGVLARGFFYYQCAAVMDR